MKRERFWFGSAVAVVVVMALVVAARPGVGVSESRPIEGHVRINGRPLAGGYIVFIPDDIKKHWASGSIDETGHYVVRPSWDRREVRDEDSFRICLFPASALSAVRATPESNRGDPGGAESHHRDSGSSPPNEDAGVPRQFSDPNTTLLKVHLGAEPTKVDIEL
jgi:hypothetical protein